MDKLRYPGVANLVEGLGRRVTLAGKTVLEVGADWEEVAASMLLEAGAAKVISTNFEAGWPTCVSGNGRIDRRSMDARILHESLPHHSVDVVFGIAVMEHFFEIPRFLASAWRVLKPGGTLFVQGGPLWTSALGHHVWVSGKDRPYHFNDQSNPIPDWHHLIFDRATMFAHLVTKGVDEQDAEAIVTYVYDSQEVNRVGYRTMCSQFAQSAFRDRQLIEGKTPQPAPQLLARIKAGPWGGEECFDVTDLVIVGTA